MPAVEKQQVAARGQKKFDAPTSFKVGLTGCNLALSHRKIDLTLPASSFKKPKLHRRPPVLLQFADVTVPGVGKLARVQSEQNLQVPDAIGGNP